MWDLQCRLLRARFKHRRFPTPSPLPCLVAILGSTFLFFLPFRATAAEVVSKKEVLTKYERAVDLVERLNVYQEDIFRVLPKIRLAGNALLNDDLVSADRILEKVLAELEIISSQQPLGLRGELRLEWLQIYTDLFQKYALLALFAFLFARWPYFHSMLKQGGFTSMGKVYLCLVLGSAALFFSLFDLSRYGESAWTFFDLQVVLLAVGGLMGGVLPGLFLGAVIGAFRWIFKPEFLIYFFIAFAAGGLAGWMNRLFKSFQRCGKISFLTGMVTGLLHGIIVYLPIANILPWFFILFSILFLALLEGVGVYLFFAVIAGILREENRREVEQELLKTKLLFLQAQMSPHFLFNALNTISVICRRENAPEAQRLIFSLSDFLRRTLKRIDEKITLREELHYIHAYLDIEKARFRDRLTVVEDFQIAEERWDTMIPILVIQPLVENAIKHGLSKKETGGTLTIRIREDKKHLKVEISDDGVGMPPNLIQQILSNKTSTAEQGGIGIGIRNIHQRMIRLYGREYGLEFRSEKWKGTAVTIRIPLREEKSGEEAKG